MRKLFKPFSSLRRLYKKVKSVRLAYILLPDIFTPSVTTSVKLQKGNIILENPRRIYTKRQVSLFDGHGELLLKFLKSSNISFVQSDGDTERISVQVNEKTIVLYVYNYDTLRVIEEIFIDQLYDFRKKGDFVVVDVGMNIAAAALYFASFDTVEHVYGFEPFPETFKLAEKNISYNEPLNNKIKAYNSGLGPRDHTLEVPKPGDGSLGGTTTEFFINEAYNNLKANNITVEIKDICKVLEDIKRKHANKKIILKLDCEGAEYEIIEALEQRSMLKEIDIYMVEYHFKGKQTIANSLIKNDFTVMTPGSEEVNPFGMLYAIK